MNKVCPVILRKNNNILEILLFKHPTAGIQLVKGTIEKSEPVFQAAIRELYEESGIVVGESQCYDWGSHQISNQTWHFVFCDTANQGLEDQWCYDTLDDYGHCFEFFWENVNTYHVLDLHSKYVQALDLIRQKMNLHLL